MDKENILVVRKKSKFEWDLERLGKTKEKLKKKYKTQDINLKEIFESHKRQMLSFKILQKYFNQNQFLFREHLDEINIKDYDLIISLGGDNHFQYITHYLKDTPILGINSDPKTSRGELLYYTTSNFKDILNKIENDKFNLEKWTRLKGKVNGNKMPLAISDFFLGESKRKHISHHKLQFKGKKEKQKCSGLLVATGAGSTGWYDSASRYLENEKIKLKRTENIAKFIVTEPNGTDYSLLKGTLRMGDKLKITSLNDRNGVMVCDSFEEREFNLCSKATVEISDKPLKVVSLD